MASWGSALPQLGGRAQILAAQRDSLAQRPAHHCGSLPARRHGSLRVVAVASRPQARVVAAPPSKDTLEQTSQAPQTKQPGKDVTGPVILNGQTLHSLSANRLELINSISDYVEERVLPVLKPVSKCWQPYDMLPKPEDPDFVDQVRALRERTKELPDDYWVVLVGDLITEEALPTYMAMLNTLDGVRDETGASPSAWGRWTRQWTAEENRHGDAMNKYMYMSGRVNMKAIEVTIQNLIGSGMDPKTENNPYLGFIYTSFQERATKISHGNTARHAKELGDPMLATLCGAVASDEGRHEIAYQRIVQRFFELDPSGTMMAFEEMMRKQIVMPAHLMDDEEHKAKTGRNLFADFSAVAQSTKTYTAHDYADIMDHLIKTWNIKSMTGLSDEGQKAQDYVAGLPSRVRRLAERADKKKAKTTPQPTPFSWIFDRPVDLIA